MYRIGIDIGGTKISTGLFNCDENLLIENKKEYIKSIKDLRGHIMNTVSELAGNNGISINEIEFCGIGIPGTVSADGKRILKAPNIGILSENLASEAELDLGIPVALIQDSRAAAWGEYLLCEDKPKVLVCITLGTGIGTGIVINGEICHGGLGSAGEIGHLPVKDGGRPCGCGKRGCLEKYSAGGGLDISAAELLGEGKTSADLFSEAKGGTEEAIAIISEAVRSLGVGLVSVINLLSPDCILFSGGLSLQKELYVDPLIEYVKNHCYSAGRLPTMRPAQLGESAPLYGAALMPIGSRRA